MVGCSVHDDEVAVLGFVEDGDDAVVMDGG